MADEQKDQLTGKASIRAGSYQGGELQLTPSQRAAMGPQPTAKTVSMDVLRDGSFASEYHHVGSTIDVPEDQVETLTNSGFAARADRVEAATAARAADAAEPAPVNTAVEPMKTTTAEPLAPTRAAKSAKAAKGKR
jgi:hypothetical protein